LVRDPSASRGNNRTKFPGYEKEKKEGRKGSQPGEELESTTNVGFPGEGKKCEN